MRYLLTLLLGLIIGGGVVVFFLGTPRAGSAPGTPVAAPDPGDKPPGTAVVEVDQRFFDQLLATLFKDLGPPTVRLANSDQSGEFQKAALQNGCTNTITLLPESGDVKTQVQFAQGKISAPLAFTGSYNLMGNCLNFKGWTQTTIQLSFDQGAQTLYGRLNIEGVNLEGVAPVANSLVTVFVRTAIDERLNPLELLRAQHLQLLIPAQASNGSLKATVRDVRSEVLEGSMRLHITYEFNGTRNESGTG